VTRGQPEQPRKAFSNYDVPEDQWIYIPVPAIISEDLFRSVQEQLDENRKRARASVHGAKYLLQGLLVCKKCGYGCHGLTSHSTKGGKLRAYLYYRCSGRNADRFGGQSICDNRTIRAEVLEEAVWADVCSLLSEPNRIEEEFQRRLKTAEKGSARDGGEQLKTQIGKVKSGIARLIDAYKDGFIEKSEFEPRIRQLKSRLEKMEVDLKADVEGENQQKEMRLIINSLEQFSERLNSGLKEADWKTSREIIRTLIKAIEIEEDKIRIIYRIQPGTTAQTCIGGLQHYWRGVGSPVEKNPTAKGSASTNFDSRIASSAGV